MDMAKIVVSQVEALRANEPAGECLILSYEPTGESK
jgi:hypothetical protein